MGGGEDSYWKQERSVAQRFLHIILAIPSLLTPQGEGEKGLLERAPLAREAGKLLWSQHKRLCEKLMSNNQQNWITGRYCLHHVTDATTISYIRYSDKGKAGENFLVYLKFILGSKE